MKEDPKGDSDSDVKEDDRRTYEGTATDDYLHITLTDEQDVPDALTKLRLIYPNLMRLDYDNRRTREDQQITAPERVENITPLQHLAAFYELQNNQPLTDDERKLYCGHAGYSGLFHQRHGCYL